MSGTNVTYRRVTRAAWILAVFAGCQFEASCGGDKLKKADVEAAIKTRAEGVAPVQAVSCPKDLPAKADESMTCTVTFADGSAHKHVVRVTDVDKDAKRANYVYGFEPNVINPGLIEQTLDAAIKARAPEARLECGDQVRAIPDDMILPCQVIDGDAKTDVRVQMTIQGDDLNFQIL